MDTDAWTCSCWLTSKILFISYTNTECSLENLPWSNGKERVLPISKISRTGASPWNAVSCHSNAPADWAERNVDATWNFHCHRSYHKNLLRIQTDFGIPAVSFILLLDRLSNKVTGPSLHYMSLCKINSNSYSCNFNSVRQFSLSIYIHIYIYIYIESWDL